MNGEGGETGACGHGPAQGEPTGEPRNDAGEEGIPGAGGIHHLHPVGGAVPGIAGDAIVVDAPRGAEGDHHAAQAHAAAVVQDGLYGGFGIGTGNGVVQQPFGLDIIADEAAIGMVNQKTTAVRVIPVVGKGVGETVEFGGLLGYAPIMPVNTFDCSAFVNRPGRIPAPIHSFKN